MSHQSICVATAARTSWKAQTTTRRVFAGRPAIVLLAVVLLLAANGGAATFTVVNTDESGPGSLRQKVAGANANGGADVIAFNIPSDQCSAAGVCTINLLSPIDIDEAVTIDGTTQPRYGSAPANTCATASASSYMRIELVGPPSTHMLKVNSSDPTTIRGISTGGGYGVALASGSGHRVQCNHLGVNGPGDAGLSTLGYGVLIEGPTSGAVIGTDGDGVDDLAERNVFGNCAFGIYNNANDSSWIAGNFFGFLADGVTEQQNSISIYMRQSSTKNLVGTNEDGLSDDLERNIVGNSFTRGVWIKPGTYPDTQNRVVGNWIGLDVEGNPAPNSIGIELADIGVDHHIRGNRIEYNITGLEVADRVTLSRTSMCNSIAGNATGVRHLGTADLTLENAWWGAADGPSGVGPGSGDAVVVTGAGSVDFTPWLVAAGATCPLVFADDFELGSLAAWSASVP